MFHNDEKYTILAKTLDFRKSKKVTGLCEYYLQPFLYLL